MKKEGSLENNFKKGWKKNNRKETIFIQEEQRNSDERKNKIVSQMKEAIKKIAKTRCFYRKKLKVKSNSLKMKLDNTFKKQ